MISERLNSTHVKCNKIITINCHHFTDKFFSVPNHQTPQKEEKHDFLSISKKLSINYQCQYHSVQKAT